MKLLQDNERVQSRAKVFAAFVAKYAHLAPDPVYTSEGSDLSPARVDFRLKDMARVGLVFRPTDWKAEPHRSDTSVLNYSKTVDGVIVTIMRAASNPFCEPANPLVEVNPQVFGSAAQATAETVRYFRERHSGNMVWRVNPSGSVECWSTDEPTWDKSHLAMAHLSEDVEITRAEALQLIAEASAKASGGVA